MPALWKKVVIIGEESEHGPCRKTKNCMYAVVFTIIGGSEEKLVCPAATADI
jgi:hypothetical protein